MKTMLRFVVAILLTVVVASQSLGEKHEASFVNQRFTVISKGLAVAVCNNFDTNMLAVTMPTLPIHIENSVAKYRPTSIESGGLFSKCDGMNAEPLQPGEVVVATGSNVHGQEFRLRIVSAPHAIRRGIGAFEHTTYESGAAELRFKLNDPKDADQVQAALRQWLRPTDETGGNTASGVQVPEIREGMTPAEVEGILGPPDVKLDSGGSTTYTYKSAGLTVVFIGGKVRQAGNQPKEGPALASPETTAVVANSESAKASPAAAAALASVGHVLTPQELADLVQKGQASKLAVVTSPPGAEVDVDGNKAGVSPLVFVLLKHGDTPRLITIKMSGYKTVEKKVVPDGKTVPLGLNLEKESQ
jgi:hypothetical protein